MLNDLTFDSYNDFFTVYSSQLIYNIPQSLVVTFITFIFLAGFYKSCKEADEGKNNLLRWYVDYFTVETTNTSGEVTNYICTIRNKEEIDSIPFIVIIYLGG